MKHSVLLDASFFIRLLNDEDPLHQNAKDYYKYFLEQEINLKVSTISIAEYCVLGKIEELPLKTYKYYLLTLITPKRLVNLLKLFLKILTENTSVKFQIIDINTTYDQVFGILDLE